MGGFLFVYLVLELVVLTLKHSFFNTALAAGAACSIVFDGIITKTQGWRVCCYIGVGLTLGLVILILFTVPETSYNGDPVDFKPTTRESVLIHEAKGDSGHVEAAIETDAGIPAKKSNLQSLKVYNGTFTLESLWKLAWRPVPLLILPPVLWGVLVLSVTVGSSWPSLQAMPRPTA